MGRFKGQLGGRLLILVAAVLWGTTGTAHSFAPSDASPFAVGALRLVLGGLGLGAFLFLRSGLHSGFRTLRRLAKVPSVWGAALGIAGYQAAFFAGVARTGVASGTLITIGSAPIWAGLLEMTLLKTKPTARWALATAMAVGGAAALVGGVPAGMDGFGIVLTLAAGASFALYTISNKATLGRFPQLSDEAVAAALIGGGLLLLPVLAAADMGWLFHPAGAAVSLHLGLLATAVPYALFGRGLTTVSAASATTLTLAEPLTAALLGVGMLGERLGSAGLWGAGLLFASLLLLARGEGAAAPPEDAGYSRRTA